MSGTNHGIRGAGGFESGGSDEAQRYRIAGDYSIATKNSLRAQTIVLADNFTRHAAGIHRGRIRHGIYGGQHQERAKDPYDARE